MANLDLPDLQALRIGSGDLVEVRVFGVPDLTTDARVSSAGAIALPLIGSVGVGGLTVDAAQGLIEKRLREGGFLRAPQVTIFVKEYSTQGIAILGEVQHPGIFPLLGQHHLFDVISAAGGLTTHAGRRITIVHRANPNSPEIVELRDDPARSAASNVEIYRGGIQSGGGVRGRGRRSPQRLRHGE